MDNGNQPEISNWIHNYNKIDKQKPAITVIRHSKNEGVAESWNILLKNGFKIGLEHGLILNDDIYIGKTEEQLNILLEQLKGYGFKTTTTNWCAFFIDKKTFDTVGDFDKEFYPAYFEDNDYHYRMRLLGIKCLASGWLDPSIYRNSMTIKKDNTLNSRFGHNQNRYKAKWGGMPMQETFTKPFNK
jgi:GT2 family glycosyltransferase